jgi:hypothetical protein
MVRLNRSLLHYLQRKKILPTVIVPRPQYEMQTLHSHKRPVEVNPALRDVDSPATRVLTQEW